MSKSDNKHTPGPWRVEVDTTLIWGACDPNDRSTNGMGYPIAHARTTPSSWRGKGPNAQEGDANARLIAAAPDLFEALKVAAKVIAAIGADLQCAAPESVNAQAWPDDLRRINAALAKAGGA